MDLRSHLQSQCSLRDWECDMCGRNGTFQYITQHHVNTCNYVTIDCPNAECGLRFQRWRLNEHMDYECEYAKISCELCNTQVERRNLNQHKKGDAHVLYGKVARAVANVEELGRRVNFLLLLLMVTGVVCTLLVVHTMRASDDAKISKMAALIKEADKKIKELETKSTLVSYHHGSQSTSFLNDTIIFLYVYMFLSVGGTLAVLFYLIKKCSECV